MKFSNKRSGSVILLQFDIIEKYFKNCDSKWYKCRIRVRVFYMFCQWKGLKIWISIYDFEKLVCVFSLILKIENLLRFYMRNDL